MVRRVTRIALPLFCFALVLGVGSLSGVGQSLFAQDDDEEESDDKGDDDKDKDGKPKKPKPGDPEVKAALDELLHVEFKLHEPNKITVAYPFTEGVEEDDFNQKGFDAFRIGGGANFQTGLMVTSGSRKVGLMKHNLPLAGKWVIKVEMENFAIGSNTIMSFTLSKKVAVSFGQVICKAKSLKPYNRKARVDTTMLAGGRTNKLEFAYEDGTLTVSCNGRKTDERSFKKGELDSVQFGMMSRNTVVIFKRLEIVGDVDKSKL